MTDTETPRTGVELQAIAGALMMSAGAVPKWLREEMAPVPVRLRRMPGDPDAYRRHMSVALSVGGLLAAFLCCVDLIGEVRFAPAKIAARAAAADPDALEAIALVQDWRPAGDEKPVLQRLAGAVRNPAYPRAWSAEKTEDDSYLVIFREPAGFPAYAFEVNLESEAVQATPEAVERLTMLRMAEATAREALAARVREAAESPAGLVARAH
ncbi:MAG: hypothetical protein PHS14_08585 [Elusimicrobia bacterium]|nr:hypothetical protein [Elusimicrobiota bacterium]